MISKVRRLEVTHCAEDLVRGRTSFPIDPIEFAKSKGMEVRSWSPTKSGISGFLMKQGDAFGIGYSDFIKNQGFINFTVGHELGHYFISGHVEKLFANNAIFHYSQSGFVSHNDCEKEADLFSASFLMPKMLFQKELRKSGTGFRAIETLSGICMTSITATAIRFAQFAEDPVAVILSNNGSVVFCEMSDSLRHRRGLTWLKAGDLIPHVSATWQFQQNKENIRSGQKAEAVTNLDEWFEGAPRVEVQEDVVGLGHYDRTLTVLFTTDELEEEDEESDDDDSGRGYVPSWRRGR